MTDEESTIALWETLQHVEPTSEHRPSLVLNALGMTLDPERTAAPSSPEVGAPQETVGRYYVRTELGRGGMGRVVEAYDPELRRWVALKLLLNHQNISPDQLSRFVTEAQITSQLEHPSIVPVHELGITDEGVLFYTMKRVSGLSLRDVLNALQKEDPEATRNWSLHKLLGAFIRVCEAVAYAHACGVVHRDLKPENIMLGAFGEVLVLDWGISHMLQTRTVDTQRISPDIQGTVVGTPGYMSPEQLQGEVDTLSRASDVWSLGAILYELITLTPAYTGENLPELLMNSMAGPPIAPSLRTPHRHIPDSLDALCLSALTAEPSQRTPSVTVLIEELQAFLEGSRRRARAAEVVEEGLARAHQANVLLTQAQELRKEATQALKAIHPGADISEKAHGWTLEARAEVCEHDAERARLEFQHAMHTALNHAPDWGVPHEHLADYFHQQHIEAERHHRPDQARQLEALLRLHDRSRYTNYLEGRGALSLVTHPPGAEAILYRYEENMRRKVEVFVGSLGHTPLHEIPLDMGSCLRVLHLEGRVTTRYPVHIERNGHWDGRAPWRNTPQPLYLPKSSECDAESCYVPAGWCHVGGDPEAEPCLDANKVWLEGFAIQRHPVTNADYIAFLDALVQEGREDEALRYAPRERSSEAGTLGEMFYGRTAQNGFELRPDGDGDIWLADWPVMMVDWYGAQAYAQWLSKRDGRRWRLPFEIEWEKAARGVDRRFFPWGDTFDASWACSHDTHQGRRLPTPVTTFPHDCSPYGVRGLGGNIADWCADLITSEQLPTQPNHGAFPEQPVSDPQAGRWSRMRRGGSFGSFASGCRAARRSAISPSARLFFLGFRLAHPIVQKPTIPHKNLG